jgi:hypothetical protein
MRRVIGEGGTYSCIAHFAKHPEAHSLALFVYYHVELDDHSLILAENTPAERLSTTSTV